ncbi:hypothetical protein CPHO_10555 [Corynebacterium phocae]|uniref:Alkaline shock response membrane anchor protein AmaP n=1 Tax=Corynebacterium phocae TaxID=161895 RepID=A0A1L7D5E3_9CORY|nr:hypothetical protein [Corynebacterium phocae]APT93261.1 hypothetical protein CPHO_10555 [Corynebacterium phocae]KAA8721582.1 alkaline shock response membrane anchor protein AmaP [Corynebacterium phocae]
MSRAVAGLDRTIFFILGLVLIALGLWPILVYFGVDFAEHLARWIDHDQWAAAPEQEWWVWALGIGAGVAALIALGLIWANLHMRRINKVDSDASTDDGSIVMHMNPITEAMVNSLEDNPYVVEASRKLAHDRKDPQLTVSVLAKAETPLSELTRIVDATESDFRAAFPASKLHTVYEVQYDRLTQ